MVAACSAEEEDSNRSYRNCWKRRDGEFPCLLDEDAPFFRAGYEDKPVQWYCDVNICILRAAVLLDEIFAKGGGSEKIVGQDLQINTE